MDTTKKLSDLINKVRKEKYQYTHVQFEEILDGLEGINTLFIEYQEIEGKDHLIDLACSANDIVYANLRSYFDFSTISELLSTLVAIANKAIKDSSRLPILTSTLIPNLVNEIEGKMDIVFDTIHEDEWDKANML